MRRDAGASAADLVSDLQLPDRYPVPHPLSVALETTHMSWVFLTESEAWKVKRPVDYDFADFSTAELRRLSCEREVSLNRRLAPDVYRGVWPVRRDDRGYSLTGDGAIVDYAVRMRRLPRERNAEELLGLGLLSPDHLDLLARTLRDFYAAARVEPLFGAAHVLKMTLDENLSQLEPFVGDVVGIDEFRGLRDWQERFLKHEAARFQARADEGHVREGHGDLRLEHVYFIDGRAVAIDCIDFNERFRILDAASDAAFFAMELEHRRRPDLAGWFLGRLAALLDDFDFYPLLDFYLCTKAWVRAKVACFVASDPATTPEKRARKMEEARSLFTLATAFTRPPVRGPRLIAIGGTVGSGKSTLAEALARSRGLPVVSSDYTRKHLAGIPPLSEGGPDLYSDSAKEEVYGEVFQRAGRVLESGRSVILDAMFARRAHREKARELSRKFGVPFLFVETRCGRSTARLRLRERAREASASDAGEDLLEWSHRIFESATELPPEEALIVSTEAAPARILPAILDRIL